MENKKLQNLPNTAGAYTFYDKKGRVLYIGKAVNLRSRVRSYFQKGSDLSVMKQVMVRLIADVKVQNTKNEARALILERMLIKKYKPPYNIMLKDDKNYLYLKIKEEDFPKVEFVRRPNFRQKARYFGPFPWSRPVKQVYRYFHKIFPLRSCSAMPKKPCLEYHMGRCLAPCVDGIPKEEYQKIINEVIDFFEGNEDKFIVAAEAKMKKASEQKNFEKAAYYRDQMRAMNKLKEIRLTSLQIQKRSEQEKIRKALVQIKLKLKLNKLPQRIEIYDISNIQGTFAVGSMVVFTNGQADKQEYRKFKIKTVSGINDVAMMKEVIMRRVKNKWPKPDLAIMDGGKGQLNAVKDIWEEYKVPVVALAKREEEIYMPNIKNPRKLTEDSEGYYLMQRMRDEAHRFAIAYHRKLRLKGI
ncbi:excinuclease ABC subunit UvrC [Patescibacteria group bacterium]|nr:excinuclease ABC subunit UvrC [Patescibacteria group bacterium]MBU1674000.1 excinuclease ABC subunit UvrC [Patescibacteria group bacterium]MBU1962927.1 excinuclease ABC subunit UvrC [Patescibacteria group bacterium]